MRKALVFVVGSLFAVMAWAAPPQQHEQPPTHDTAGRQEGQPHHVAGTVVAWDEAGKSVTVRDLSGKERKFALAADTKVSGKPAPGQMVTVLYTPRDGQNVVREVHISPQPASQGRRPTPAVPGTQPAPAHDAAAGEKPQPHDTAAGQKGQPHHVAGTVVAWDEAGKSVTVRDLSGKERKFALAADSKVSGKPAPGQMVTVLYTPRDGQNFVREVHISPQPASQGRRPTPGVPGTQPTPTTPAPTAAPKPSPEKK